MARIVLAGYMARYPLGGMLSWTLQWLLGFQALGHDIYFIEKAAYPNACFDPGQGKMGDDCSYGVATLRRLFAPWGLDDRFCFVDAAGRCHGLDRDALSEVLASADLFIDMGSHGAWLDEASACGLRVLVESEPSYTQFKLQTLLDAGQELPTYDAYYTNGLNIGTAASDAPTAGIAWRYVMNPVMATSFDVAERPDDGAFTTVMNWQAHDPIEFRGRRYGQKDIEFAKFERLPSLVDVPVEVAAAGQQVPTQRLVDAGWRVLDAHRVTVSIDSYYRYIRGSLGEIGICKNVFVATNNGWFSDRSAAYLACGRPVVMQATGFERYLPCGRGLFAVDDAAGAAEAIREIVADYPLHSRAAREIALEHLDARRVLGQFLRELGI
ncbi:MAG: hypothetical protein PVF93_00480 [Chromatiaceae bacterium]